MAVSGSGGDVLDPKHRISPLGHHGAGRDPDRLAPAFFHAEREYRVMLHLIGAAPVHRLGAKVGNVAYLRDDIVRAYDLLITGV